MQNKQRRNPYIAVKGYEIRFTLDGRPFIRHDDYGVITECQDRPTAEAILTEFNIY